MKSLHIRNSLLKVAFILVFLNTLVGCEFESDPIDPRLPMYSTTGQNAAGAYINNEIWISQLFGLFKKHGYPSFTHFSSNDSLILNFDGSSNDGIEFHLSGLSVSKFADLIKLGNQKIQLDGKRNAGVYLTKSAAYNGGVGQIYFTNADWGEDTTIIIVSGTFGFSVYDSEKKLTEISYGRFDFEFDKSLFYSKD